MVSTTPLVRAASLNRIQGGAQLGTDHDFGRQMTPLELVAARKGHLSRLANQRGAAGEQDAILLNADWIARPRGRPLRILLDALARDGKAIKASAFDALAMPAYVNLSDPDSVQAHLAEIVFIEIKTANQARVRPGFDGFFFALTENEIIASDLLGSQHRVALFNKLTGEILLTSVPEIVARSKSRTWQLSLQL